MKKTNYSFKIIYLLLLVFSIMQIYSNETMNILISSLIILIGFFYNAEKSFILLFVCLPFFNFFNSKMGETSLFYILVLLFILKYIISYKNKYKFKNKLLLILIIVLYTSLNIINLEKYISWIVLLIPFILSYKEDFIKNNFSKIILYYGLSMCMSSFIAFYMYSNNLSIFVNSYVYNNNQIIIRFSGLIGDSNVYSQSLLLLESLLLFNYFKGDKSKLNIVLCGILIAFGILTYSKMNIISAILLVICIIVKMILDYIKNRNHKIFILFAFLIVGAVLFYIFGDSLIDEKILSAYIKRFSSADLLTGRLQVYTHFINILLESPLKLIFGMSFEEYSTPFYLGQSSIIYSHNLYLETICIFGIVVFLILLFLLIKLAKKSESFYNKLPLYILLVTGLILHGHFEFLFYFNIIMIVQCLLNKGDDNIEKEKC